MKMLKKRNVLIAKYLQTQQYQTTLQAFNIEYKIDQHNYACFITLQL